MNQFISYISRPIGPGNIDYLKTYTLSRGILIKNNLFLIKVPSTYGSFLMRILFNNTFEVFLQVCHTCKYLTSPNNNHWKNLLK